MKETDITSIKPFSSTAARKHKYRWRVYFSQGLGERRGEKLFETKEDARVFEKKKRIEILNTGLGQGSLNDVELREALWARDSLKEFGVGIQDAVQYFIDRKRLEVTSITVADAIPLFLEQKEAAGLSLRHIQAMRQRVKRFSLSFGDRLVADISTREITAWLNKIKSKDSTRNGYRT